MRALVTGATGFLGQRLALRLQSLEFDVTATGRDLAKGQTLEASGLRFAPCDLADTEGLQALCQGQDFVFHSGALSSPWGDQADFYRSNVLGTEAVIAGCLRHGVRRLIHVSTPSIYFGFRDRLQVREDDPLPPRFANAYAATKWQAEEAVRRAHREQGLPAVILRPRAIFGPGDQAILPRLIRAHEAGAVPLINGGRAVIDVTYVENVVDALLCAADAPEQALGQAYNITNGEPMTLRSLLDLLFAALGEPARFRPLPWPLVYTVAAGMELKARLFHPGREPLLTRYSAGVLAKSQTLDITAARRDLNYQPRVTIQEGVLQFAAWWREQGHA